jgi:hypothetical protein
MPPCNPSSAVTYMGNLMICASALCNNLFLPPPAGACAWWKIFICPCSKIPAWLSHPHMGILMICTSALCNNAFPPPSVGVCAWWKIFMCPCPKIWLPRDCLIAANWNPPMLLWGFLSIIKNPLLYHHACTLACFAMVWTSIWPIDNVCKEKNGCDCMAGWQAIQIQRVL